MQHTITKPLFKALSLSRPAGSKSESEFVAWLAINAPSPLTMIDEAGNLHFCTDPDSDSRTLFVAHTDTAAYQDGPNTFTKDGTILRAKGDVLGADDGAGIALLYHMMAHFVPGYYIFTRAEEVGATGSRYLADNHQDLLTRFDRAIAFDRRGTSEVITHQGGQRTASDEFATTLAEQLAQASPNLLYSPSNKGTFTDTKIFASLIPECTNIAVGYENEHGPHESLDLTHLSNLADAVLRVDWENLPTERMIDLPYGYDSYLDEAIADFKSGNTQRMIDLLATELATDTDLTISEARRYIRIERLTPSHLAKTKDLATLLDLVI